MVCLLYCFLRDNFVFHFVFYLGVAYRGVYPKSDFHFYLFHIPDSCSRIQTLFHCCPRMWARYCRLLTVMVSSDLYVTWSVWTRACLNTCTWVKRIFQWLRDIVGSFPLFAVIADMTECHACTWHPQQKWKVTYMWPLLTAISPYSLFAIGDTSLCSLSYFTNPPSL